MGWFSPGNRTQSPRNRRIYAIFELIYTTIDFAAALSFLSGSLMLFDDGLKTPATWCYVAGSMLFALKPTSRVIREFRFAANGDVETLAKRIEG